ncbi:hypothetical protein ACOSQ2_004735 [Xanthoceras sorbifolium]
MCLRGGVAGLGAVARDDYGVPRLAASWFCKGVVDVELGEALALLEGAVARDDCGVPRVAASWFCKGVLDVKLGEAFALLEGVAT